MLIQLWTSASDKDSAEIASAANRINAMIASDPLHSGESRAGERRMLIVLPLVVEFIVDEATSTATVTRLWRPAPRSS